VTAQDKATNRSQHITIQGSSGLSEEEIESMVSAAEEYRGEDRQRKERIEVRNAGDAAIYAAERALKDLGEKTDPAMKAGVDETLETLRKALAGEDLEAIRKATSTLQQEVQRIGAAAYQQQDEAADEDAADTSQPESEADAGGEEQSPDEEIMEGEFTEE